MAESNGKSGSGHPRVSSASAIRFFIVDNDMKKIPKRPLEELDSYKLSFGPLFTHQIFTLKETIYGYKNLKIDLFLSWASLKILMKMHFTRCNYNRDNVEKTLSNHFGEYFTTNEGIFKTWLEKDITDFTPPGERIWVFTLPNNISKSYEIFKNNLSEEAFTNEYNRILKENNAI